MRVRDKGDRGVVQSVVLFLGVSVLSGALAAGLAIPFAGLAGFSTEKTAETFQDLPQELKTAPLTRRSTILAGDGSRIAELYEQNRVPLTSLAQISPIMQKAIVAIEDDRYFEHGALDAKGTLRALIRNQNSGGVQQGGSSITQQYVKLSLVEKANAANDTEAIADATADTYERKIAELRYAIAVEKEFSKEEILLKYLNLANFGDGAFGVEAASMHYFRVHAAKLTLAQSAMLAGLVKNPTGYDPTNYPKRAKERRDVVLRRMAELNVVSAKQANDAIKTPVLSGPILKIPNGCANSPYPFYCEYVVSKLIDNPAFGKTDKDREHYIKTAGLTIQTTLDPKIQKAAQKSIEKHSKPTDQAIAAITLVEPGTGVVKAMVQSRPYGFAKNQTAYNYNVDKSYKGGYGGFQNGSTMKAFTIAAAISKGYPLTYRINSPMQLDMSDAKFSTCNGTTKAYGTYVPKNSTNVSGDITMVDAARASTNTYFLQLSQRTGLCPIATIASKLGMYDANQMEPLTQTPSMTLGVGNVSPLQLANAYASFAARGKYCTPLLITTVKSYNGKTMVNNSANCKQVLTAEVADGVNAVLHQVMEPGGTGAKLKFGPSALAGKTGTIQQNRAVWFAGYSSRLAAASVVADASLPYENLITQTLNGKKMYDASGSGTAGPLWETAMQGALAGTPTTNFTAPTDKTVRGDVKDLPFVNGMSPEEASNKLRSMGFEAEIAPGLVPSAEAAGTVAYTGPRQADGAPEGSKVTIFVSDGSKGQPQPPPTTPGVPQPPNPPNTGKPGGGPITPGCPPWHPKYPNCGGR
jgi:membrane peptidoglycan carboxypeptidase